MDVGGRVSGAMEAPLVAAARAGDTFLVKQLLEEDEDYGDHDERVTAFAVAVQAFHGDIAELLLVGGADASQCAPDELLSLREAVDSGSPALVGALLDGSIRDRYPVSELMRCGISRADGTRRGPKPNCGDAPAPQMISSVPGSRTMSTTQSASFLSAE